MLKQHRWRCNLGNSWKLNNTPTMYSIWGWFLQVFTTHKMVITWEWFTIGFTTCYISYFKLLMLIGCIYTNIWHYLAMESQHGTPVWTHKRQKICYFQNLTIQSRMHIQVWVRWAYDENCMELNEIITFFAWTTWRCDDWSLGSVIRNC